MVEGLSSGFRVLQDDSRDLVNLDTCADCRKRLFIVGGFSYEADDMCLKCSATMQGTDAAAGERTTSQAEANDRPVSGVE